MSTYIVIDIDTQTALIDFSQVTTSGVNTMRRNNDNSQAMITYAVEPSFITNGRVVPIQSLDKEQATALLKTDAWAGEKQQQK